MQSNLNVPITNNSHRYRLAALAAALTVSFGAASPAGAGDLECTPDVHVTNKKGASIKVLNFRYTVNGVEHTEPLTNKRLAVGEQEHWHNQKLNHAATGIVITSSRIEYKDDTSGGGSPIGDPYGPPRMSRAFPHTFTCTDEHNYNHDIE